MTDRRIQYMDLDKIEGALLNPKGHAEQDLAVSLERWGFTEAPLLDERTGRLVVGHGRIDALRARRDRGEPAPDGVRVTKAGRWQVPAQRGWASRDDQEAFAYLVAGNQLTTAGGWTDDLGPALDDLVAAGASLDGLGFTAPEIDQLLPSRQVVFSPDEEVPPAPSDPFTRPGDLWLLGSHRLVCGDATDQATLTRALDGALADLVWTDPPYGVEYVGGTSAELTIANDEIDAAKLEAMLEPSFRHLLAATRPGACWYVASPSGPHFLIFGKLLADMRVWRQTCVWVKDSLVLGRADYHGRHESILYGWTPPSLPQPPPPLDVTDAFPVAEGEAATGYEDGYQNLIYGWSPGSAHSPPPTRKQDTVWEFPRPRSSQEHPTMKPVNLVLRAIRNSSSVGDLVVDPFAGSGSTLMACEIGQRRAALVELDPVYCDVIAARWERATGGRPLCNGEPYSFVQ